jgi:hypothetical protein
MNWPGGCVILIPTDNDALAQSVGKKVSCPYERKIGLSIGGYIIIGASSKSSGEREEAMNREWLELKLPLPRDAYPSSLLNVSIIG